MNIYSPTIKDINVAITNIRRNILVDPNKMGNAGSFFKNPIINRKFFNKISEKNIYLTNKYISKNNVKLYAAELIEQTGWKGKRVGNTGVSKKHSLIIVNYGNATGIEINNLANNIIKDIQAKFYIKLEKEVIVI